MPANPYLTKHESGLTDDPLLGFTYLLDVSGKIQGFFTECTGLGSENEVIEHKVVDEKGHEAIRKIPGRLKWGDITLKRGITASLDMWTWRDEIVQGKVKDARANCTITMLDRKYEAVAKWNVSMAWPSKLAGPSLKSDSNEFGVEEIVIVHEGIHRES